MLDTHRLKLIYITKLRLIFMLVLNFDYALVILKDKMIIGVDIQIKACLKVL